MPKSSNFPTLYDNCKTISISKLKSWNYLKLNSFQSGEITWSREKKVISSIGIAVKIYSDCGYLELDYKCNDKSINYKIELITKPSNLGKGRVWFFVCPQTGKHCRKLYFSNSYFLHRTAFKGLFYEKQIESKKMRNFRYLFGNDFLADEIYEQIYSKYFKKTYNGKPTKRYLRLKSKLNEKPNVLKSSFLFK